jgi:hypothetical protein
MPRHKPTPLLPSPNDRPLPSLVDDFLHAANTLKWNAMQLAAWHGRFDVAGAHMKARPLTTAEQLNLDRLLVELKKSDARYVAAHDNFVAARSAALARQRVR